MLEARDVVEVEVALDGRPNVDVVGEVARAVDPVRAQLLTADTAAAAAAAAGRNA